MSSVRIKRMLGGGGGVGEAVGVEVEVGAGVEVGMVGSVNREHANSAARQNSKTNWRIVFIGVLLWNFMPCYPRTVLNWYRGCKREVKKKGASGGHA
jgi:hypothetical protein